MSPSRFEPLLFGASPAQTTSVDTSNDHFLRIPLTVITVAQNEMGRDAKESLLKREPWRHLSNVA